MNEYDFHYILHLALKIFDLSKRNQLNTLNQLKLQAHIQYFDNELACIRERLTMPNLDGKQVYDYARVIAKSERKTFIQFMQQKLQVLFNVNFSYLPVQILSSDDDLLAVKLPARIHTLLLKGDWSRLQDAATKSDFDRWLPPTLDRVLLDPTNNLTYSRPSNHLSYAYYNKLFEQQRHEADDPATRLFKQSIALLRDYARENNWFQLLFSCHLGRHHTEQVNNILINHPIPVNAPVDISHIESLIDQLLQIKLRNDSETSSLWRRIRFITHHYMQLRSVQITAEDSSTMQHLLEADNSSFIDADEFDQSDIDSTNESDSFISEHFI